MLPSFGTIKAQDIPFPCEINLATQRNSKKSTVPESSMSTSNMASCK